MPTRSLEVRLHGKMVGHLSETRGGARFAYCRDLVDELPGKPLLSTCLPVKQRAYAEGRTRAWFSGLLPEGERLSRICRGLHVAEHDYFNVLAKIGWECAGAVSVIDPEEERLPYREDALDVSPGQVAFMLKSLSSSALSLPAFPRAEAGSFPEDYALRVSLGGFQDKLCVVMRSIQLQSEGWVGSFECALPSPAAISTHILKPQPEAGYKGLVEAEAWAMHAARFAARCADAYLLQLKDAPLTLVVRRFDRTTENGAITRIHQEDCCQALGLDPKEKYAATASAKGTDPSYAAIAGLLATYAQSPDEELAELLRQMTVNVALGNLDAHAKNYSLVYENDCMPRLSPLYDVVPVSEIEPNARHQSMRIGGKILAAEIGAPELVHEASTWGMAAERACGIIENTLEKLAEGIRSANETYPAISTRCSNPALERVASLQRGLPRMQ